MRTQSNYFRSRLPALPTLNLIGTVSQIDLGDKPPIWMYGRLSSSVSWGSNSRNAGYNWLKVAVHPFNLKPVPNTISSPILIVAYFPSVIVIDSERSQVAPVPNDATTVAEKN